VFSRLPKLAVVAALACSMGLHWGFFQSVAWVGMVIHYSHDAPLTEALMKTFDGHHPCALCKETQGEHRLYVLMKTQNERYVENENHKMPAR
jgi:hypothetical protein